MNALFLRIDLVKRAAIGEMRLVRLGPAAKALVNREQRQLGKLAGVFGFGLFAGRAVIVAPGNVLPFV